MFVGKKNLMLMIGLLALLAVLAFIGGNASADTHTLVQTGDADVGATWDTGTAPETGDDLILTGAYNLALNQAIVYGNITLAAGYSGTATQGSVDFGYHDITIAAGTWKGVATNTQTCSGSFVRSGGTITPNVLKIVFNGETEIYNANAQFKAFINSGNLTLINGLSMSETGYTFVNSGLINIETGKTVFIYHYTGTNSFTNSGIINGPGKIGVYSKIDGVYNFGTSYAPLEIYLFSTAAASRTATISSDATLNSLKVSSQHVTNTMTFDASGYNVSVGVITIGTRGILQCGEGMITTASLDSSAGVITPETATWMFTNNSLVKMAAGGTLYDVEVNGTTLRLDSDVAINSLTFTGLTASHSYGLYYNGVRNASVSSTASGTYSIANGTLTWDNATLLITPMVSIDGWTRIDGGFRNLVWQGYDYWADHDCDLPVVWSLTASHNWLSIDSEGTIYGVPHEDGTIYYTITATYANGEIATVSGYIVVETTTAMSIHNSIVPLIGLFAVVIIIGMVATAYRRIRHR